MVRHLMVQHNANYILMHKYLVIILLILNIIKYINMNLLYWMTL